MAHITLTFEDFQRLVRGQTVERAGVALILEDAGFPRLIKALLDAAHGLDPDDDATEHATVPAYWVHLAEGRMGAAFWLQVAPRAYDLIAEGMAEEAAVLAAIEEYRVTIGRRG